MSTSTEQFLATHPVFTLDEAERQLSPKGGRAAVLERLMYAAERGRVKRLVHRRPTIRAGEDVMAGSLRRNVWDTVRL